MLRSRTLWIAAVVALRRGLCVDRAATTGTAASARGISLRRGLPSRSHPGVVSSAVTQENIANTICVPGWTATVRPPTSYTQALKRSTLTRVGMDPKDAISYELPGGHPKSPTCGRVKLLHPDLCERIEAGAVAAGGEATGRYADPFSRERRELNVLKPHLRITLQTLLKNGTSQREIERVTGVDRKTIRRCRGAREAKSPGVATGSAEVKIPHPGHRLGGPASACEAHREWIESQVRLGRNAVSIFQDLVELYGFDARTTRSSGSCARCASANPSALMCWNSPPGRSPGRLRPRCADPRAGQRVPRPPVRDDAEVLRQVLPQGRLEDQPGDLGAAARAGLARLRRNSRYVVLDNLREGVITPDLYAPALNPVYAATLAHYGVVADPAGSAIRIARVRSSGRSSIPRPRRSKGRRFESIEEQNAWLAHWESAGRARASMGARTPGPGDVRRGSLTCTRCR